MEELTNDGVTIELSTYSQPPLYRSGIGARSPSNTETHYCRDSLPLEGVRIAANVPTKRAKGDGVKRFPRGLVFSEAQRGDQVSTPPPQMPLRIEPYFHSTTGRLRLYHWPLESTCCYSHATGTCHGAPHITPKPVVGDMD